MADTTLEMINNLGTQTMIGGSDMTFVFNCLDSNGSPIDITGATVSLKVSPYGQSNVVTLTKTGVITDAVGGVWKVFFVSNDTSSLYGVYSFQPKVISAPSESTTYIVGQGILNVVSQIT